jgi:hypothetical protein
MIMNKSPEYSVTAYWGPRPQDPKAQVGPFLRTLDRLSRIHPVFGPWYLFRRGEGVPVAPLSEERVCQIIADGVGRSDIGTPEPITGYQITAATGLVRVPNHIQLRIHAGNRTIARYFINTAILSTQPLQQENAAFITCSVMKDVLLAFVDQWHPTWCGVQSSDLYALYPSGTPPSFKLAWMTYLSPRFAQMVTPPQSAIVERTPGEGLLMIAAAERFDAHNPAHLAAARDIDAAIAPVNALPWPPDRDGI